MRLSITQDASTKFSQMRGKEGIWCNIQPPKALQCSLFYSKSSIQSSNILQVGYGFLHQACKKDPIFSFTFGNVGFKMRQCRITIKSPQNRPRNYLLYQLSKQRTIIHLHMGIRDSTQAHNLPQGVGPKFLFQFKIRTSI